MLATHSADSKVKRTCARRLFDEMPQEQVKVSAQRNRRKMPMVGLDTLPDDVLARILSFLPVREAVQTCVLARRWRHLWQSMPVLRIISVDGPLTPEEVDDMNRFVNMIMFLRDRGAPLEFCEFKIDDFDSHENEPHISLWIQQALLSQARSVNVELPIMCGGLPLDDMHLISKHLTTLELRLVALSGKFLDFSSCPVLKSLQMRDCDISSDRISSQSLKYLTISGTLFSGNSWTRTRIAVPSLVCLELTDNTMPPLLESMPSLVKAFVRLNDAVGYCGKEEFGGSCSDDSCDNCADNGRLSEDCMLLKGLSKAESLELVSKPGEFIFKRDLNWCPLFSNLKTLLLNEWCVEIDFDAPICFLEHAPVLEKLTLQLRQAPENWVEPRGFYIPSEKPFTSNKLKVVELKCKEFDERVHQISRMLSIYNEYIEQINIQWLAKSSQCYSFQADPDDQQ
ncbi:unnamed protein product [Urochloa humidicola]